ncbi:PREDICTED: oxidation resistance protein 1 isoform X6 [Bactrocera latifrons]|uniref:oxidation resistance protein 1 isoform X6 n=1 Tax=Bactrocera latifrons TaxID=174628 RepID=UPI0008DCC74A|nr:PREDICTED: oxidation resistance protein 1 isoform X6 [Bactrocera latifrons]
MSIIDSGRYRLRKDWASASIPSLVDIDEHVSDEVENSLNITTPLPPPKPPRRSSLALGLFSSKGDKSQKRRSSIAVFLRRDSNKNTTKDSYESAVKHEKSDGSNTPASPEISFSSADHVRASSPNEPGKVTYFDDGSSLRPIVKGINNIYDSPVDKERNRRRRSSLQAKLERHRRKNNDISQLSIDNSLPSGSQSDLTNGSMGGSAIGASSGDLSGGDIDPHHSAYFPRQKRHSWWNIFVPDNLKTRSRRASQDVSLLSRSVDNLAVPVRRSKSRSVDHGLAAPFDLDSLRSKVEGRFESVDRLTNERKKSSLPTIPTKSYTVGNRDTLTSVAARFDTTPSELTHLNRLNSSFIYPGQQLLVPDKSAAKNDSVSGSATGIDEKGSDASISGKSSPIDRKLSTTDEQNDENDILEGLRPGSPKPGHIERVDSAKSTDNAQAEANKSDDPVITQRFLKINVRHITDGQGVVGGVLLVTPNAVMFDPNVSDPLVIEHGPESYGVIAPMELVVNAAIFHDIAHMRVSGGVNTEQNENAEIYYPQAVLEAKQAKEAKERGDECVDGARKQSATGGSMETCDDQESLCSNTGEREQKDAEKGVEAKEECAKTDDEVNTKANKTDDDADANDLKKTLNLTDSRTTLEERRKSLLDHHWAIPSKDRRSSIGTFMRPQSSEGTASTTKLKDVKQQPKLDYRSMVSVDDKPELFISVDKLIPRPARACPDPPLYLRLRMGKPIGKAIPLPTSVMSYGKNKLRPEYWFSVPKNRVDELYRFINTWVQHLYGELNEEQIKARGFELIQDDTEWTKSGTGKSGRSGSQENEEISDLTRESWEVLSMSTDDYRKASLFATGSFDLDFPIPDLIGTTEILTEEHREKLCGHLPARAEGYSWSLIFSTSQHGFSLNSLYRKMQKLESPILIVIQDTDNNVFGALTSCSLHVSDHFYGTGESLLYKFNPSFKVFHWTGENLYFIKGNMESLSIGAGDGRFGLWLDGDLNQGRSQSCSTYGNEPLAPQEDFVIKTLECWAFV